MTYRVKVSDIREVFNRVHSDVLEEILCSTENEKVLPPLVVSRYWHKLHGVRIVYKNDGYDCIQWLDFDNERDYIMFMLRWS